MRFVAAHGHCNFLTYTRSNHVAHAGAP
jgi:hypothetical protein